MDPNLLLKIIKDAIKQIPSLKYAFGVLGLVSIVALVSSYSIDHRITVYGVIFLLIMSAIILLFSKLSSLSANYFKVPAIFFLWFSVLLTIILPTLLVSSIFFKKPLDLSFYLVTQPVVTKEEKEEEKEDESTLIATEHFKEIGLEYTGKIRFIERWNNSLIVGHSDPNSLYIYDDAMLQNRQSIAINGKPIDIAVNDRTAVVSTNYPSAIHVIDLLTKKVLNTFVLPASKGAYPSLSSVIDGQLPSEITSFALINEEVWVIASDNSNAVLYVVNLENGTYEVPDFYDDEMAFDARGWQLKTIGQKIYAIETDSVPSGIHLFTRTTYKEFGGHDYDLIGSATNIWESPSNSVSFINQDNDVIGTSISGDNIVPTSNYGNLGSLGVENWIDPTVKVFGDMIYMAINEATIPSQKMLWSTIISFNNGSKKIYGEVFDAEIADMEVFKNKLILLKQNADGEEQLIYLDI